MIQPEDLEDTSGETSLVLMIHDARLGDMQSAITAIEIGKKTAGLAEADLPAIKDRLIALKKNARQVSDVVSSQTALVSGEVDIILGGGEWVTAGLTAEKPNLDWTVPKQGALRFV